jgi:hypothetical protein
MIKRRIPKSIAPAETLKEHSFTALHGINNTTAPTIRDNVYDITNMDVNLDGSLSIRKPLIYKDNYYTEADVSTTQTVKYLFDSETLIKFTTDSNEYVSFAIKLKNDSEFKPISIYDSNNNDLLEKSFGIFKEHGEINVINTVDSSIISGIFVNLKTFASGKYNPHMDSELSENWHPRYFKIVKENGTFKAIYIEPEIPTIIASETISLNYNTTSNYTYSVKDDYQSSVVGVSSILPFVPVSKTLENISNITVEELTQSKNFVTFSRMSETNTYKKYVLKAFLNFKKNISENCYCVWEKSYDGISWVVPNDFLNRFETEQIDIKDDTVVYESLTETVNTVKRVDFCNMSKYIKDDTDSINSRPDVLILDELDSATYRFRVVILNRLNNLKINDFKITTDLTELYEIPLSSYEDFKNFYIKAEYTIDRDIEFDHSKLKFIYSTSSNASDDISTNMKGVQSSPPTLEEDGYLTEDYNYKKYTINFKNVKLSSGYAAQVLFIKFALTYGSSILKTDTVKVAVYYTDEFLNSLEAKSVTDFEQDTTYKLTFVNSRSFTLQLTPKVGNLIENVKKIVNGYESNNIYKFSLDGSTAYYDYDKFVKELDKSYITHTIQGGVDIPDSTFTISEHPCFPDGVYEYVTYLDLSIAVKFNDINLVNFSRSSVVDSSDLKYKFIVQAVTPDGVTVKNPKYFKVPYYTDSKHFTKIVGDSGNFMLAWNTPNIPDTDKFSYVCYRQNSAVENPKFLLTLIKARAIKKTTTDYQYENEPLEILNNYYWEDNHQIILTKPSVYDGVRNIASYSSELPDLNDSIKYTIPYFFLGQAQWSAVLANNTELLDNEIPNTVTGKKLYHNHRIFTYGAKFKNCIYVTDVDSFNTPIFNVIDLNASEHSVVTTLVPWRNYLIAATNNSIYLIKETEAGFVSKLVNTYIGIPEEDSKTCLSILNSIVFKSGTKIYSLQPSVYSNDDSILNITEISKPIAEKVILGDYHNFAFSTEQAYYLFTQSENKTVCLKYEFSRNLWTKHVYNINLIDYHIKNIENITVLQDNLTEFSIEKDYETDKAYTYGDIFTFKNGIPIITPIEFSFDSGQKIDDLSKTKQFVESKIMLATLHDKDTFPLNVDVYIDGLEYKQMHFDAATDAAMWKTSEKDVLTLSSNLDSENKNLFNVMRQMILRYSGKGRTIRHVISGNSCFNFKFYVLYYRYKITHNKQ